MDSGVERVCCKPCTVLITKWAILGCLQLAAAFQVAVSECEVSCCTDRWLHGHRLQFLPPSGAD